MPIGVRLEITKLIVSPVPATGSPTGLLSALFLNCYSMPISEPDRVSITSV